MSPTQPPRETAILANALPKGTRLGEFELRRVIGGGGFGIVYMAFDHLLEREVAIKEYMPASMATRDRDLNVSITSKAHEETFKLGLRSFVNEAKLLARFDHRSLLKVHRFWEERGTAYMVMPLLRGRTAREVRHLMDKPPDEAWMRGVLEPVLGALEVLHDNAVYHRDIAPDNILLGDDGVPVLLDFGAARHVITGGTRSLTAILKPSYAPIEQYGESSTLRQGAWTDIYALGATMHYLIAEEPPAPATVRLINDDALVMYGNQHAGISQPFLRVIDWMLAPRPADRPQSVAEVREALAGRRPVPSRVVVAPAASAWQPMVALGGLADPERTIVKLPSNTEAIPEIRPHPGETPREDTSSKRIQRAHELATAALNYTAPAGEATASDLRAAPPPKPWPAFVELVRRVIAALMPRPKAAKSRIDHAVPDQLAEGPTDPTTQFPGRASDPTLVGTTGIAGAATAASDPTVQLHLGGSHDPASAGRDLEVRLVIVASEEARLIGRSVRIDGPQIEIGREVTGLNLSDRRCSRRHAVVEKVDGGYRLRDLGSSNATFLNGRRLAAGQSESLLFGAKIRIGSSVIAFVDGHDESQADHSGGEVAGRYALIERLHVSPKGSVYRSVTKGSELPVAIKILGQRAALLAEYRAQFDSEASIAKRLNHNHICVLRDYGIAPMVANGSTVEVPFLCYTLLEGGSLADRLQDGRLPEPPELMRWIEHIAEALHYAHSEGVVHGNLKPSAICFSKDGHVYVTDFTIGAVEQTANVLIGAPAFLAPEQWAREPTTAQSDQFALAAIAYTLLTGSRPFEGQEDPDVRARNLTEGPKPAHEQAERNGRAAIASSLDAVLHRALARNAGDRFESTRAFALALAEASKGPVSTPGRNTVFISYRRDCSAMLALFIQSELRNRHLISAFVDTTRLDGALHVTQKIANAIEHCEVFVCLLSSETLDSNWVREEIRIAHKHKRPMIPIFQESFDLSLTPKGHRAISALLRYEALEVMDKKNVHVERTVEQLAKQISDTLSRRSAVRRQTVRGH